MADSEDDRINKSNLVVNQHYDETVEVNDDEEVASTFTPSPRPGGSRANAPGRLSMSMTDQSGDEFDHDDLVEKKEPAGYVPVNNSGNDQPQMNQSKPRQRLGNDDDDDDDDGDQSDSSDDDDDDDDNHGPAVEGAYDPSDYEHLPVSQEIKELFEYITRYTPQTIDLEHKLKPFIPDFIPAVGDIDAFLKVTRPDGKPETLGLLVLDEPTAKQSDPTVLDLQLRTISKQTNLKAMTVRSIEDVDKNPKAIDTWIDSIRELHLQKPAPTVHYQRNMPDIEELMQEWPPEFEDLLNTVGLPTAELDVDLAQYVDLICGILDIPVHKNRIHSLHVLFTLFSEFKNSQHFHQLAKDNQLSNDLKQPSKDDITAATDQLSLNEPADTLTFD
ncbi:intraflagellar transport protein 46 homolog [Exaiptasia diaphana]|uniref:Intraflagellar transport protein 46 homolog n=1 Tax=Exaiptasia diaphana TaxID=2652724 RepID=A0A913XFT3_EXADI|nr:intraflagellar transport protein 46 homolog [Exaiptasia diaphana]KXJ20370.1 Intraflagellar transport protein 46-like [Exaiptasia diaphana]